MLKEGMKDNFGDKRIAGVTTLAKDLPAAYPNGPSHKAGTLVYQSCLVQTEKGVNIGFTLPSATAMALNIAIHAGREAEKLKRKIVFDKVATPKGTGFSVSNESNNALYDYFEACMKTTVFSFQALEIYCNYSIINEMKGTMDFKRSKKRVTLTPEEIEKQLSTEEKLSQVMPKLKGISTPKGKAVWEPFRRLKTARDSIVHLKTKDQKAVDRESIYFQFLNRKVSEFPVTAINMIKYFVGNNEPRWLKIIGSEIIIKI